tara:strand:+ start:457 stop:831 length:375 start_codon:yes stop_codon:yes gene_type:complete
MELIEQRIINRAKKAFKCIPFNNQFYMYTKDKGLNSQEIFRNQSKFLKKKGKIFNNANDIESAFLWLIMVGILRREVDGQGLTSQIRLTPLGRKILESDPNLLNNKATLIDKINTCIKRILLVR